MKKEKDWKKILTEEQYHILREKGTEPAFRNKFWNNKDSGTYFCAACGSPLFSSKDKFDSGTGWPSFTKPEQEKQVGKKKDFSLIIPRTEVICSTCKSHLGHVFKDGPKEKGGKRYCINSAALNFKKKS